MRRLALLTSALALTTFAGIATAEVFDAVGDFPASGTLPASSGNWIYGYSDTLGGTFVQDTNGTNDYFNNGSAIVGFYTPLSVAAPNLPAVLNNATGGPYTITPITAWSPAFLLLHPGQSSALGEYSIVRFVAPDSAMYSLDAVFQGLDTTPTSTDVHVLVNGASVFDSTVDSYGVANTYNPVSAVALIAGDTIDFAVGLEGKPSGNDFFDDSTGFQATVTEISASQGSDTPEPATYSLFGFGMAGLFLVGRRRSIAQVLNSAIKYSGGK